jgi:very-short-patch-repair endonuclease
LARKPPLSKKRLNRSRELRNEPTEAEKKLWERLRRKQLGVKFRRQHPAGPFILDFFCHEARLAVPVVGSRSWTEAGTPGAIRPNTTRSGAARWRERVSGCFASGTGM